MITIAAGHNARATAASPRTAPWRRHADAIVEAYQQGRAIRRIQAEFGLWDSDLYRLLAERGIPSRKARRTQTHGALPSADELARQYAAGATAADLARRYGVSRATVSNRLHQAGTTPRSHSQTALLHHRANWEHLAPEIVAALRTGQSAARICAAYPVSRRQLRRLRRDHGLTTAPTQQKDAHTP